jgi:hypothetical protein
VGWQEMPSSLLRASTMMRARRLRLPSTASRSFSYSSYDSSPDCCHEQHHGVQQLAGCTMLTPADLRWMFTSMGIARAAKVRSIGLGGGLRLVSCTFGGFITSAITIWPPRFEQRLMDAPLYSCCWMSSLMFTISKYLRKHSTGWIRVDLLAAGLDPHSIVISHCSTACRHRQSSTHPPRRPHSPKNPLEVEFIETRGTSLLRSRTIFLKLLNSLPAA